MLKIKRALAVTAVALSFGAIGVVSATQASAPGASESVVASHWCWYQGWRPCPWH